MEDSGGEHGKTECPACSDEMDPYIASCTAEREQPRFHRFLDLPRELRDSIYDLAHDHSQKFKLRAAHHPPDNDGRPSDSSTSSIEHIEDVSAISDPGPVKYLVLQASIECRPPLSLLLCSKTIRRECEERSKQSMKLKLKDNDRYGFQTVTLPEQARDLLWAEIHLILFCCNHPTYTHADDRDCHALGEITSHRRWIEKLVTTQMRELRSFSIHAHLCYSDHSGYRVGSTAPCEAFISKSILKLCNLPKLKALTLSKCDFKAQPDLEGSNPLIFEWPSKPKADVSNTEMSEMYAEQEECLPAYGSSDMAADVSA